MQVDARANINIDLLCRGCRCPTGARWIDWVIQNMASVLPSIGQPCDGLQGPTRPRLGPGQPCQTLAVLRSIFIMERICIWAVDPRSPQPSRRLISDNLLFLPLN